MFWHVSFFFTTHNSVWWSSQRWAKISSSWLNSVNISSWVISLPKMVTRIVITRISLASPWVKVSLTQRMFKEIRWEMLQVTFFCTLEMCLCLCAMLHVVVEKLNAVGGFFSHRFSWHIQSIKNSMAFGSDWIEHVLTVSAWKKTSQHCCVKIAIWESNWRNT